MQELVGIQTNIQYSRMTALGASELPMAFIDVSSVAPYELFEANIALIQNNEGAEIPVRRGALALADANNLGIVAGFLIDSSNGYISHLVLCNMASDNRCEVIVPVSEVAGCDEDKVFLHGA